MRIAVGLMIIVGALAVSGVAQAANWKVATGELKTLRAKLAKRLRKRVDGVLAVLGNHRKACAALATLKRSVPAARKADVTRIARVVGC